MRKGFIGLFLIAGLFPLLLSSVVLAEVKSNWAGAYDTLKLSSQFGGTSTFYSKTFNLKEYTGFKFIAALNDTSSAGFANDSIEAAGVWLQTWSWCPNSSGVLDTCWGANYLLDSISFAKKGTVTASSIDSAGNIDWTFKNLDTIMTSGYMTWRYTLGEKTLKDIPDQFGRLKITGGARNTSTSQPVQGYIGIQKSLFVPVREYR